MAVKQFIKVLEVAQLAVWSWMQVFMFPSWVWLQSVRSLAHPEKHVLKSSDWQVTR